MHLFSHNTAHSLMSLLTVEMIVLVTSSMKVTALFGKSIRVFWWRLQASLLSRRMDMCLCLLDPTFVSLICNKLRHMFVWGCHRVTPGVVTCTTTQGSIAKQRHHGP